MELTNTVQYTAALGLFCWRSKFILNIFLRDLSRSVRPSPSLLTLTMGSQRTQQATMEMGESPGLFLFNFKTHTQRGPGFFSRVAAATCPRGATVGPAICTRCSRAY